MDFGSIMSLAGPVLGGLFGSDSAEQASNAQQQATDAAIAENRRQFDLSRGDILDQNTLNRGDLAPYRAVGRAGVNRLAQLMGLDTGPEVRAEAARTAQQQYEQATARRGAAPTREQFTRTGPQLRATGFNTGDEANVPEYVVDPGGGSSTFDQAGYDRAMAEWNASAPRAPVTLDGTNAPNTRGADFGYLTSDIAGIAPAKKFTLADFWDDPVTKASYAQGLEQGTKALDNMAGARGMRNSGATLKALTRFGIDYTGNQAAGSESRFTRNEDNIYRRGEADYGREVQKRDTLFNRLSGLSGTGQTATNSTVNSGTNAINTVATLGANNANTVGGLLTAQGNARGAAAIAGGNAFSGGLTNAANTFSNWWNGQNRGGNNSGNYNAEGTYRPFYAMSSDNYG